MMSEVEEQPTLMAVDITAPELGYGRRLILRMKGRVLLRHEKREGWSRPLPIYASRCRRHGLYEDYPHGWKKEIECPLCLLGRVQKYRKE